MPERLSYLERVVLIGLCRYIINSDGTITDSELNNMKIIAGEIGFFDYIHLLNEADKTITSLDSLKKGIESIDGKKNGYQILKWAIKISMSDANITEDEIEIISYAANLWDIDIKSLINRIPEG